MMNQHAWIRVALVGALGGILLFSTAAFGQACDRSFYGLESKIFEKSNESNLPLEWSQVAGIQAKTIFGNAVGKVCAAYSDKNLTELFGFKVAFGRLEYLIPLDLISRGGKLYEVGDSPSSEIPGQFSKQGLNHLYSISVGLIAKEEFVAESSDQMGMGRSEEGGMSEYSAYVLRVDVTDKASIRPGSIDTKPSRHILTLVNEWNRLKGQRNIFAVPSPESLTDRKRIKNISFGTTNPPVSWVQDGQKEVIHYQLMETYHEVVRARRGFFGRIRKQVRGFNQYVYHPVSAFEPVYRQVEDREAVRSVIYYEMAPIE
jgi:hypothetical protein